MAKLDRREGRPGFLDFAKDGGLRVQPSKASTNKSAKIQAQAVSTLQQQLLGAGRSRRKDALPVLMPNRVGSAGTGSLGLSGNLGLGLGMLQSPLLQNNLLLQQLTRSASASAAPLGSWGAVGVFRVHAFCLEAGSCLLFC